MNKLQQLSLASASALTSTSSLSSYLYGSPKPKVIDNAAKKKKRKTANKSKRLNRR